MSENFKYTGKNPDGTAKEPNLGALGDVVAKLRKTLETLANATDTEPTNSNSSLDRIKNENQKMMDEMPDFLRNMEPGNADKIIQEFHQRQSMVRSIREERQERDEQVTVARQEKEVAKQVDKKVDEQKSLSKEVAVTPVVEKFKLTAETKKQIRELPNNIKSKIYGQDEAIDDVITVLKTSFAGLSTNEKKPKGAYIFAGPSGCGKTETVVQIAEFLGLPIKKFSMTEFSEENDVKKLIGAPAGYIGYEDGGQLTNFASEHPNSIILLDEIEKADPSLSKILLGVLEDGKLTDGKGKEVDFRNTMFFATSNLGSEIEYATGLDKKQKDEYRMNAIKDFFPIEVINRFDSLIQFNPISKDVYAKIVNKVLSKVAKDFSERHEKNFEYAEKVVDFVVEHSYDPAMGGRPAGRFLSKVLIKSIVDKLFEEDDAFENVDCIKLNINAKGNIIFRNTAGKTIAEIKETQKLINDYNKTRLTKEEEEIKEKAKNSEQDSVVTKLSEVNKKVLNLREGVEKDSGVETPVKKNTRSGITTTIAEQSGDSTIERINQARIKRKTSPKRS